MDEQLQVDVTTNAAKMMNEGNGKCITKFHFALFFSKNKDKMILLESCTKRHYKFNVLLCIIPATMQRFKALMLCNWFYL